jgi:hypothetical protein
VKGWSGRDTDKQVTIIEVQSKRQAAEVSMHQLQDPRLSYG